MKLNGLQANVTDWSKVPGAVCPGESGIATVRVQQFGEIQLRVISYSQEYVGDHWCSKGHIVFLASGNLTIEHQDGRRYDAGPGMSYHVMDEETSPHRVISTDGAIIFIVD
jgi:hypothetical protein